MFDLQLGRIVDWITSNGFKTVALQFPEGLKSKATTVADHILSNTEASVVISGDPCYGACDIFDHDMPVVHFGHSRIPSMDDGGNVLYVEARVDVDIDDMIIPDGLPEKVGILATVQYLDLIPAVTDILERNGHKVSVGVGDERTEYPGQVLGCNCSSAYSADADAFLFIGEGDFHPLAASFGTSKDVFMLNPVAGTVKDMGGARDRILRKRFAAMERSKDAERFLIIVCSKKGQRRDIGAAEAERKIKEAGKAAYTVVLNEITPDGLLHYDVDVFVNTACPRIAMDDSARYGRPMITLTELDIVLGLREWDDYEFDQIGP